jgi:hypothetical protein
VLIRGSRRRLSLVHARYVQHCVKNEWEGKLVDGVYTQKNVLAFISSLGKGMKIE